MRASSVAFKVAAVFLLFSSLLSFSCLRPEKPAVLLYTTTSIYDSGLIEHLLSGFDELTVKVIAVGTGEALKNAEIGNADVLIVHSPELEKRFLKKGVIGKRKEIAWNYFVLAGPLHDPAEASRASSVYDAFRSIHEKSVPFVSRADGSGTHFKEVSIWKKLRIDPSKNPSYMEAGLGMAESLKLAAEKKAYTLTDVATLSRVRVEGLKAFVFEEDDMKNIYSACLVSDRIIGRERYENARKLFSYLCSREAASKIEEFSKKNSAAGLPPVYSVFPERGAE